MMSTTADDQTITGSEFISFTSNASIQLNNANLYIPSTWIVAIYVTTGVVAGFGNITVLMTFATKRKLLKKNFNVLILNLALVDLAVGIFDLPFQVRNLYPRT